MDELTSVGFLKGYTDTIILKLLLESDKYGYQISKIIYEKSEKEYSLKEATLYSSLRKMEKEGLIIAYWGSTTQGGRRKYYSLTPTGKKTYFRNKKQWEEAMIILHKLM